MTELERIDKLARRPAFLRRLKDARDETSDLAAFARKLDSDHSLRNDFVVALEQAEYRLSIALDILSKMTAKDMAMRQE